MHKVQKLKAACVSLGNFPHCDPRVLHAPKECELCDEHMVWQALRLAWGIAFTGWTPDGKELPCPADYARGDSHKSWGGNVAYPGVKEQTTGQEVV